MKKVQNVGTKSAFTPILFSAFKEVECIEFTLMVHIKIRLYIYIYIYKVFINLKNNEK